MNLEGPTPGKLEAVQFVSKLNEVFIYPLIILISAVALLVFVYGCFEYVLNSENPAGRDTGRKHIIWGITGLLVIISAYAIMSLVLNTFGLFGALNCAQEAGCAVTP